MVCDSVMRLLVATLFTALAATSFADEIDYEVFLNDLWNQTDVNKDGALSYPEVVTAFGKSAVDIARTNKRAAILKLFGEEQ